MLQEPWQQSPEVSPLPREHPQCPAAGSGSSCFSLHGAVDPQESARCLAPCCRALRPWGAKEQACSLGKGSFLGGLYLKHHSGPWPQWPEHPALGEVAIGLSGGFLKLPAVTTPVRLSKSYGELSSLLQVPGVAWKLLEPLLCLGMVLLWWYCSYHRMINGGKSLWRSSGPTPSQSRASFGLVW